MRSWPLFSIIALPFVAAAVTVAEPAAELPLIADVDVVVVGGNVSGVAAAAGLGAVGYRVYVVAPRPFLGDDFAAKLRLVDDCADPGRPAAVEEIFDPAGVKDAMKAGDTTPMRIKRVMDERLMKAGVPVLAWTRAYDVLSDAKGVPAGVVTVNRNGRQAVRARWIVDATDRGAIARAAGCAFAPAPGAPKDSIAAVRMIVADRAPADPRVKAVALSGPVNVPQGERGPFQSKNQPKAVDARLWKCEMTLPMKDFSARSFAEAEQLARDLTWVPSQADSADTILWVSPDRLVAAGSAAGARFRSKSRPNVFVTGSLATGANGTLADAWRDGEAIAAEIVALDAKRGVKGGTSGAADAALRGRAAKGALEVRESRLGVEGLLRKAKGAVKAAAKELPLLAECDVLVVGAGTGGGPAAISAARAGAKTIVVEYLQRFGGIMTDGSIGMYCYGIRRGFTRELDRGVNDFGVFYGQCKAEWMRAEARGAGAEIWFGADVTGLVKEGDVVRGAAVTMADGTRGFVAAKVVIDATGNADMAALAGEPTEFVNAEELSLQGAGSTPKILGASYQNTDSGFVDDSDAADLTFFSLRARSSFGSYVWDQGQTVNSRERRRMHGAAYITVQDVMNERTYPDVIAQTKSNFDTHGQTVSEQFFIDAPHAGREITVNVPFRAILPKKTEGLLVIGLGMSAHRDAMPILRMQPDVQNQGYAAGFAAATAVKDGVTPRNVDIRKVQRHLVEKEILPRVATEWKDSFPLPEAKLVEAVKTLPDGYRGLSAVYADFERSRPLVEKAYAEASDPAAKLVYAHVLGLAGDPAGADALVAKLASVDKWDEGWNWKGMDQYGRSVSWVDSWMIAAGRTKDPRVAAELKRLGALLSGDSRYSHVRALSLAAESLGDRSLAPVLAGLLAKPKMGGHFFRLKDGEVPRIAGYDRYSKRNLGVADRERGDCLRELCLARALYRLGDKDGLGRSTLEAYAADPRRAYGNHARQVLGE